MFHIDDLIMIVVVERNIERGSVEMMYLRVQRHVAATVNLPRPRLQN